MESISINDLLWIQWNNHLVSFNYLGMPKGIHYTIAFNENSPFVNLHLTKNAKQTNKQEKPKIEICRIRKKDFFEIIPKISLGLLFHVLEEVQEIENYQDYYYISFEEIEKEGIQKGFEKVLFENFRDITKLKQNKRLKIKGDIESKLEKLSEFENEEIQEIILNNLVIFNQNANSKGGILISEDESISLLKIQNKWFKYNSQVDLNVILNKILGNHLYNYLEKYISNSFKIIEKAKGYQDCEKYDKPITLEIQMPAANKGS